MKIKEEKIGPVSIGALIFIYIISFLLNYIALYISSGTAMLFISSYFSEVCRIIISPTAAVLMLFAYCKGGIRSAILRGIFFSVCTVIYTAPSSALNYAYSGYEITDVLILSLLNSLLSAFYSVITYSLLFLIMLLILKRCGNGDVKAELECARALDFSSPLSLAALSACGCVFVYGLIREIIDTVEFLIKYSESYTAAEIFTMLIRYVFILAMVFISYFITFSIKNLFIENEPI